jgi:ketosteroid isomerase-like protein
LQRVSYRDGGPGDIRTPLVDEFSYNINSEADLNPEHHKPTRPEGDPGPESDEFFQRLPSNLGWPKLNDEAISAAVEAIQRISGGVAGAELVTGQAADPLNTCSGCGGRLQTGAPFCGWCGLAANMSVAERGSAGRARDSEVHHYHHHYHHFASAMPGPSAPAAEPESAAPRGRVPGSPGTPTGGRAEALARQVAQDWVQACNTRHLDDLLELYAADASLIRSGVPPVRSLPAVREFLHALLEAGLGEVEMESLRLEVMGEIALDLGRCKMLVPGAMGKRREERGKYLLVLVRQPVGTWKILADCWVAEQALSASQLPDAARKAIEPGAPMRKPR